MRHVFCKPSRDTRLVPDARDANELDAYVNHDTLSQMLEILGFSRVESLFDQFISEAEHALFDWSKIDNTNQIFPILPEIHRISGSAATFGAKCLRSVLLDLERKGRNGDYEGVLRGLQFLAPLLENSKIALKQAICASQRQKNIAN